MVQPTYDFCDSSKRANIGIALTSRRKCCAGLAYAIHFGYFQMRQQDVDRS